MVFSCDLGTEFFSFFELQLKNAIWILLQSISEFLRTYLCGADGWIKFQQQFSRALIDSQVEIQRFCEIGSVAALY